LLITSSIDLLFDFDAYLDDSILDMKFDLMFGDCLILFFDKATPVRSKAHNIKLVFSM